MATFLLSLWNQECPLRFIANKIFFLASLPSRRENFQLLGSETPLKNQDFLGDHIKLMHLEGAGMSWVLNLEKCWINPFISTLLRSHQSLRAAPSCTRALCVAKASGSLASRDLVKFLGFALFPSIPKAPSWPGGGFQAGNVPPIPGLNFPPSPSSAQVGDKQHDDKMHNLNYKFIKGGITRLLSKGRESLETRTTPGRGFFPNSQFPAKPKSHSHHRKCLHQKSQRLLGA